MTLDELIFARLTGNAGLVSLIGQRCYPGTNASQDQTLPYIVWSEVDDTSVNAVEDETGTDEVRVQFEVFAGTRREAKQVLTRLRAALRNWVSSSTDPRVEGVSRQQSVDDFEQPIDGSQLGDYRLIQDYLIWVTAA